MTELSMLLYEGQSLPGFAEALPEMRTRSLRGVWAELRVAMILNANGHGPRLVARAGVKGSDFDIEARVGDQVVPVEVKAKEGDTVLSPATVLATIRDARQQIPKEGPGVVVLAIPGSWTVGKLVKAEAVNAVTAALRNSRRLNAVVLLWEAIFPALPSGRAFTTVFHLVRAEDPKVDVPGIADLLSGITPGASVVGRPVSFLADLTPGEQRAERRPEGEDADASRPLGCCGI